MLRASHGKILFDHFLQGATTDDPASEHSLGRNHPYGLYATWCFLRQAAPGPEYNVRSARAELIWNEAKSDNSSPTL